MDSTKQALVLARCLVERPAQKGTDGIGIGTAMSLLRGIETRRPREQEARTHQPDRRFLLVTAFGALSMLYVPFREAIPNCLRPYREIPCT